MWERNNIPDSLVKTLPSTTGHVPMACKAEELADALTSLHNELCGSDDNAASAFGTLSALSALISLIAIILV